MDVPRRSRKRPRKGIDCPNPIKKDQDIKHIETIDLTEKKIVTHDNAILPINGDADLQAKKLKKSLDLDIGRRNQPHRAARFRESYNAPVDNILISDEEKEGKSSSSSSEDSDSDCEIIPKSPTPPLTDEQQADWERRVKELQQELRKEDTIIALLNKLKQSQETKEEKKEVPNVPTPLPPHISSLNKARALKDITITTTSSVSMSPTKKLLMNTAKVTPKQSSQDVKRVISPALRNDVAVNLTKTDEKPVITIQPINTNNHKVTSQITSNAVSSTNKIANLSKNSSLTITVNHQQKTPSNEKSNKDLSAQAISKEITSQQQTLNKELNVQQQALQKAALCKQLEKTLFQIPAPKHSIPDFHFVPSANPLQFIYYLGLDVVVDFLTKTKKPSYQVEPFVCSECKTDFTPTWRTVKKSKSSRKQCVICNSCFSNSTKQILRKEHTARLKAALVKAAQQEKEIERLSASGIATNITPNYSAVSESNSQIPPVYSKAPSSSSSRTSPATATSPNFFLSNPNLLNLTAFSKLTPQQLQAFFQAQAQSFMAANMPLPPHMVPYAPFIPPYPFHLPNKSSSSSKDLQRQYLLDMIPSRRQT